MKRKISRKENRDFGNEDTWKDPSQKDLDMTFHTKKGTETETQNRDQETAKVEAKEPEPCPISGVKVSESSNYNPNAPATLEEIPEEEAVFLLYSDGTVRPNEQQFGRFNNSSYYASHDFQRIFQFRNRKGGKINMKNRKAVKCLKAEKPARVSTSSQNGWSEYLRKRNFACRRKEIRRDEIISNIIFIHDRCGDRDLADYNLSDENRVCKVLREARVRANLEDSLTVHWKKSSHSRPKPVII